MNGTDLVESIVTVAASTGSYNWILPSDMIEDDGYTIMVSQSAGGLSSSSGTFSIIPKMYLLAQSHLSVQSVTSEETASEDGDADNVLDGDLGTIWHTSYSGGVDAHPHELVLHADTTVKLAALAYYPRSGAGNGTVSGYEVYAGSNGTSWTKVASGTLENTATEKMIVFDTPIVATFVRFVALSEVGGQDFASAAELNIWYYEWATGSLPVASVKASGLSVRALASKHLSITGPANQEVTVELFSLNGRKVFEKRVMLGNGGYSLDLRAARLAPAQYTAVVSGRNLRAQTKFSLK